MSKITILKGVAATLTAAATPWLNFLAGLQEITARSIALTAIASLVAGATAGAAFLSTSVADDKNNTPK